MKNSLFFVSSMPKVLAVGALGIALAGCHGLGGKANLGAQSSERGKPEDRSEERFYLTDEGQPFFVDMREPVVLGRIYVTSSTLGGGGPPSKQASVTKQCTYLIPVWLIVRNGDALSGVDPAFPKLFATPRYDRATVLHGSYLPSDDVEKRLETSLKDKVKKIGLDSALLDDNTKSSLVVGGILTAMFGGMAAVMTVVAAPLNIPLLLSGSAIASLGWAQGAWNEYARAFLDQDVPDPAGDNQARVAGFSNPYENKTRYPITSVGPSKDSSRNNFDPGVVYQGGLVQGNKALNRLYSGYVDLLTDLEVNNALDVQAQLVRVNPGSDPVKCPTLSGNSERPEGAINPDDPDGRITRREFAMPKVQEKELREVLTGNPVPVPAR